MSEQAVFLLIEPDHFDVTYCINPWMQPSAWQRDPVGMREAAHQAHAALRQALHDAGGRVVTAPGVEGVPDLVFSANAAVVLDGRVLPARFRHLQRQAEEAAWHGIFENLHAQGLVREIGEFPPGCFQEGAGDCIWDERRKLFWVGHGPRSSRSSIEHIQAFFDVETVSLPLASEQCYHLDVGFCPLAGGEILYYPDALEESARRELRRRVPPALLIEATLSDLRHFSVNAVSLGESLVMSRTTPRLRNMLAERGYRLIELDLSPFMLSGGSAYCLTLRLDHARESARAARAV